MTSSPRHWVEDSPDAVALAKGTITADFESINTGKDGEVEVKDGYSKLDWDNFYAITPSTAEEYQKYKGSGFFIGVTSGKQDAYNGEASGCSIHLLSGTFSVDSVEMTAAFDKKLQVEIHAFDKHFNVKYDIKVNINDKTPTLVKLNFSDITELVFQPKNEVEDPKWANKGFGGPYMAFDDFKFSDISGKSAVPIQTAQHAVAGGLGFHGQVEAMHALPHGDLHSAIGLA